MSPDDMRRLLDRLGQPNAELRDGKLPAMAGAADPQLPVSQPLGGPDVTGTLITVDEMTNPPTRIPAIIRDLVAANEGYFAEDIFSTPGFTVQGGAIIYNETFPQDFFLDPDQSLGPRAPGSEAPNLAAFRKPPKVARPESWSGNIEITDEARRRNQLPNVQNIFRKAANTFADVIQRRAIETLNAAITDWGRTIAGINWRQTHSQGVTFADPTTLPQMDFGKVMKQFVEDKAGIRPDLLIVNPEDGFYLDLNYGDKLQALLDRYGLTMKETPHQTEGQAIFAKSKQIGVLAFEKPLDQEYERLGRRKTDSYTLEATPVPVAIDASSVVRVEGIKP
jgi:hypothetical protein